MTGVPVGHLDGDPRQQKGMEKSSPSKERRTAATECVWDWLTSSSQPC